MAYDEQDAMLFFDHVLVPWDRLFCLYDSAPILLPNPQGDPLQLPKPALLLALQSKDSTLYDAASTGAV